MNDKALGSDILAVLGIAVLEREAGGQFRMIGSAPYWFLQLCPGADAGPEALTRAVAFPFFENFLEDAEEFWKSNGGGRLKSGLWTETGPLGEEVSLEASAVCLGSRKIVLIENQTLAHDEKQSLLQRARKGRLRERERRRADERGSR
ncbi:MAG TPA: hypothetical protein VNC59_05300 [Thermoanaerobaculia bacterium]|nr:hypothetical protein [Thermoanaerobaculia bacterium]